MVIHVTIDTAEPLTGSASCCERGPVPFTGWLQLLRAVAELVGASACTADQRQSDVPVSDRLDGDNSGGEGSAAQAYRAPATLQTIGPLAADFAVIEP